MKRRSLLSAAAISSLFVLSCTSSVPVSKPIDAQAKAGAPSHVAPKPVSTPVEEPLQPAVVTTDAPETPAPVAVATAADEPLTAPVDTRSSVVHPSSSSGAGGLGLSGIGEGGGGRGEGIGLGSVGTIGHGSGPRTMSGSGISVSGSGSGYGSGHGRLAGSHRSSAPKAVRIGGSSAGASTDSGGGASAQSPAGVQTGEWDDNANFREFSRWLGTESRRGAAKYDVSVRRFVVVRDNAGKPVPSCNVDIKDASGKTVTLRTSSHGRALLFPRAEGLTGADFSAIAKCQGTTATQSFRAAAGDGIVDLTIPVARTLPDAPTIDVAFVLDTTGSMSEEITALRDTLEKVATALGTVGVRPRVGLVEYKDRGDSYVTRMHQMTTDVAGLQGRISALHADGGGDTPEHVNEAVRVAVRSLNFKSESIARLVFLIGDAPPHLDYAQDEGYVGAMKDANHAGVQIYSIAASGMDPLGQVVFRQLAQYTGGTHMFVLRGGAGPQSTGGGDPRSSCGGTHTDYSSGNLDALIISKVRAAIAAKDGNPLRIAGLHKDEKDLPCDQRIVMAQ